MLDNWKNLSDYRIFDDPPQLTDTDYDELTQHLVDKFSQDSSVLSIYTLGGGGDPGISDLDVFIVFDDARVSDSAAQSNQWLLYGSERDIALDLHPISVSAFQNLHTLFSASKLELVYGESITILPLSEQEKRFSQLSSFIDLTPVKTVELVTYVISRQLPAHRLLLYLYALRYSIQLAQEITGVNQETWRQFEASIIQLRRKWFTLDSTKYDKLLRLLLESVVVAHGLLDTVAASISEQRLLSTRQNLLPSSSLSLGFNRFLLFSQYQPDMASKMALYKQINHNALCRVIPPNKYLGNILCPQIIQLPYEYALYYQLCALQGGDIGQNIVIRPEISSDFHVDAAYKVFVERRMKLSNELAVFFHKNHFTYGFLHLFFPKHQKPSSYKLLRKSIESYTGYQLNRVAVTIG